MNSHQMSQKTWQFVSCCQFFSLKAPYCDKAACLIDCLMYVVQKKLWVAIFVRAIWTKWLFSALADSADSKFFSPITCSMTAAQNWYLCSTYFSHRHYCIHNICPDGQLVYILSTHEADWTSFFGFNIFVVTARCIRRHYSILYIAFPLCQRAVKSHWFLHFSCEPQPDAQYRSFIYWTPTSPLPNCLFPYNLIICNKWSPQS